MAVDPMWKCSACGTQGLLVTNHLHCPACGHEQEMSAHYVPSAIERASAERHHPFVGRDLACVVCQSLNSRASNYCGGCGCSLAGAREMPTATGSRARMLRAETSNASMSQSSMSRSSMSRSSMSRSSMSRSAMSRSGMSASDLSRSGMRPSDSLRAEIDSERARQAELSRARLTQASETVAAFEARRARRRVLGALVVLLVGGLIYLVRHKTKAGKAEVMGHGWERIIEIEKFGEEVDTAPCDRLPPRSELIGPRGGANRCAYRLSEWRVDREAKLDGEGVESTREWPTYRLRWTGQGDCENCEREGERYERFILRLRYQGRMERCEVDRGTWELAAVGDGFEVGDTFECSLIGF